jgi:Neprosin
MKNRMICETIQRFSDNVKNAIGHKIALGTTLALFMFNGFAGAQSGPAEFVPFRSFIDQTTTANASNFLGQPSSKVKDAAAFEQMRQHILNMYQGVDVIHSFVRDSSHYDCVPIMQQPAVRKYGIKQIATPPPQSSLENSSNAALDALAGIQQASPLDSEKPFDEFGNSTQCEDGTVAMRRITLETTTRFQSLRQFFQKSPNEQVPGQEGRFAPPGGPAHKYSITYQYVDNHGGQSNLNVWDPQVNTSLGEVFSLTQEWYVGGINTGVPPCGGVQSCSIQTEEVGWVVYPAMFGDEKPHLFIFSTPDGYDTGCWDNSCGDFVVVKDGGDIGASLSPTSVLDGAQYEIALQYQFTGGNWWVCVAGTCIGYYPGSMYHGGQNTKHAQEIEFGTEAVGTTVWPPAGSGQWPSKGYKYAAYQRDLFYINTSGKSVWDSLTPDISSPKCYSIGGPFSSTGAWTVYFYDGGPGGKGC